MRPSKGAKSSRRNQMDFKPPQEQAEPNAGKLERTRQLVDKSTLDVLVEGQKNLISSLSLPDENGRHVLAAAIRREAQVIVTMNLKLESAKLSTRLKFDLV